MLYLTFLLLLIPCSLQSSPLVFLTFSSNGQQLNVSMVSDQPQGNFVLEQDGQSQPLTFLYNISARQASNGSLSGEQPQTEQMFLYGVEIEVPTNASLLDYSLRDADNSNESFSVRLGSASSEANLSVCVFGDYRADMMYTRDLNLSAYAEMNGCHLLLFIGKISWEQRDCPQCNSSISSASLISSGNPEDLGLSFSPFSMLDDHMPASQVSVFGKVPALFGATSQNQNETSFFDCTEVGGVALIQTTVELSTTARLGSTESEQFKQVEHYFRETMLNELECKLQELHRRPQRPWILVYLTHPSLINEKETAILSLKDNDRFFDILNRYHVDLLLSCGVEGMAQILKERQQNKPAEELPPYLGTTMATCLDEKTCQYLVLDIGDQQLDWRFMDGAGTRQKQGQFQKSSQAVDKCVPDWIPSITGRAASNGTETAPRRRRRRR